MGPSRTSVSRDDKAEGGGGGVGRLVEWVFSPKFARYIAGSLTGAYNERQSVVSLFFSRETIVDGTSVWRNGSANCSRGVERDGRRGVISFARTDALMLL